MNTDQRTRLEIMRALGEDFPDRLLEDLVHAARYVEHGVVEHEPPEPDELPHMPDEPRKWASLADIPDTVWLAKDHDGDLIKRLGSTDPALWFYPNLNYSNLPPSDEEGPFIEVLS